MKYIAREYCYSCEVCISEGEGNTREEAITNCLNRISPPCPTVFVELADGLLIEEDYLPKSDPPNGLTLVLLDIYDHCAGGRTSMFRLGMKPGTQIYHFEPVIGTSPVKVQMSDQSFSDSISLPEGSMKYESETGEWVSRNFLRYNEPE